MNLQSLLCAMGIGLGSGLFHAEPAWSAEPVVLDRVVVVLNGDVILESELDDYLQLDEHIQREIAKLGANPGEPQIRRVMEENRAKALDNLIGRRLVLAQNVQYQITAAPQQVQAYLQHLAQLSGMSMDEFKKQVRESTQWGSWSEYEAKLREDIILFQLEHQLAPSSVSEAQIRDFYRKMSEGEEATATVRRLILRPVDHTANADDQAYANAKAIARRLRAGEGIEKVAKELGREVNPIQLTRRQVAPIIADALFDAKKGQVVGPIKSGQGYHVFLVEDVHATDLLGFEEAKERLRAHLEEEARLKAREELYERLRAQAHVDIRL